MSELKAEFDTLSHTPLSDAATDTAHEPAQDASKDLLRLADLPSPDTQRWDSRRKAQVVEAVRSGVISIETASRIYDMSIEEFLSWQILYDRHGHKGLTIKQAWKSRKKN